MLVTVTQWFLLNDETSLKLEHDVFSTVLSFMQLLLYTYMNNSGKNVSSTFWKHEIKSLRAESSGIN